MAIEFHQLFGVNATQDEAIITIYKRDLPGLIPLAENKAEQLLAALFLRLHFQYEGVLIDENSNLIVDENLNIIAALINPLSDSLIVSYWKRQSLIRNDKQYLQDTLLIKSFTALSPEDI